MKSPTETDPKASKPNVFSKGFFNSNSNAAKPKAKGSNSSLKARQATKVIVIGNQHVGKTSVISRYCKNVFKQYQAET